MLTDALESDPVLRRTFFPRMRVMIYGGAGLPQSIMDRLRKLALDETGRPVPVTTGFGATETVAGCRSDERRAWHGSVCKCGFSWQQCHQYTKTNNSQKKWSAYINDHENSTNK